MKQNNIYFCYHIITLGNDKTRLQLKHLKTVDNIVIQSRKHALAAVVKNGGYFPQVRSDVVSVTYQKNIYLKVKQNSRVKARLFSIVVKQKIKAYLLLSFRFFARKLGPLILMMLE